MLTNNKTRFIIFHNVAETRITDLDATVDHAENLVNGKLLPLFMDFTKCLKQNGYYFLISKEGDDQ